jgi:phosphoribosylpyrophosphate synthetase
MRQDKIFLNGEALSAEIVLKELKNYADKIFLINSHNQQFREKEKFEYHGIEIYNIDAFSEIAKYFKNLKNAKVIVRIKGRQILPKNVQKF